eukprot:CAMPEP_0197540296 /NCGR_PEP_ID=MMETSP1318-20131121/65364_1 /TAXON_ID=552666 /ORGANISM="Partenskyella glossopodia, Strain RCC365" /LENGTH=187 /DNA_ID=CAMNT_0043099237 /DNA_START=42 /DNA_END=602 /DNA_ORIENTATION=+
MSASLAVPESALKFGKGSTSLNRLLNMLEEPWQLSKVAGAIDENLLEQVIENLHIMKPQQKTRLLAAFLGLRKEQVRALRWKLQEALSVICTSSSSDYDELSLLEALKETVLEQFGEISEKIENDAKSILSQTHHQSQVKYSKRSLPEESCVFHSELLPRAFVEEEANRRSLGHFGIRPDAKEPTFQ